MAHWVHGKAQFTKDKGPTIYVRYGPFTRLQTAEYALLHVQQRIKDFGGIHLDYSISKAKEPK